MQCLGNLQDDIDGFLFLVDFALVEFLANGDPLDVLHHEVVDVARRTDVDGLHDVVAGELGGQMRFALGGTAGAPPSCRRKSLWPASNRVATSRLTPER